MCKQAEEIKALTQEVAAKHDQVLQQEQRTKEVLTQKDKLQMQINYQNMLIESLRKDIKKLKSSNLGSKVRRSVGICFGLGQLIIYFLELFSVCFEGKFIFWEQGTSKTGGPSCKYRRNYFLIIAVNLVEQIMSKEYDKQNMINGADALEALIIGVTTSKQDHRFKFFSLLASHSARAIKWEL